MKEDENQTRIRTYGVLDPKTQLNTSKWAKHSYQWIEGSKLSIQTENRSERSHPEFDQTLSSAEPLQRPFAPMTVMAVFTGRNRHKLGHLATQER